MTIMKTNPFNFSSWQDHNAIKTSLPCRWKDEDLNFHWHRTLQTDEIPTNDKWDIFTTDQKLEMEKLFQSWKIPTESTEHWMSFPDKLNDNLSYIMDYFNFNVRSYTLLKLTPGHMLVWHFDTYATLVKRRNLTENDVKNVKRSIVMMNEWNFGQIIQIGKDVLSDWRRGDVFTWNSHTWHGAANFGNSDIIVLQISYLDE